MTNWEVQFTDQFHEWWIALDEEQQEAIAGRVKVLQARGPALGRPTVDPVKSSRHRNMKELRCSKHGVLRVLFAFDPTTTAILLIGGDKSNTDALSPIWNRWYDVFAPIADDLYDDHLALLEIERN